MAMAASTMLRATYRACFMGITLAFTAHAAAAEKPLPTKKIMTVVKTYANSVGCFTHMDSKNIVRAKVGHEKLIVALYSIDEGCSGGSAMHRPAFAVLKPDSRGGFMVRPEYSIPSSTSEKFTQYTDRIFVKGEDLWFAGREFNWSKKKAPGEEGDALCCPSIPIEGRVVFTTGKKVEWAPE